MLLICCFVYLPGAQVCSDLSSMIYLMICLIYVFACSDVCMQLLNAVCFFFLSVVCFVKEWSGYDGCEF